MGFGCRRDKPRVETGIGVEDGSAERRAIVLIA